MLKQFWSRGVVSLGLLLGGCATVSGPSASWMPVDEQGRLVGTGFDAVDLIVACNAIDEVINSLAGTPGMLGVAIVVEPVSNDTRFNLPEEEFNQAIFRQLHSNAPLMSHIMRPDSSITPHMYLMGRLQRVMPESPQDHEILLYSYRMVDAANNEVIWEGSCEVKTHLAAEEA